MHSIFLNCKSHLIFRFFKKHDLLYIKNSHSMLSITKLTPTLTRQSVPLNSLWDNSLKYLQFTIGISICLGLLLLFFNILFQQFRKRHLESTPSSPPERFKHCFGLSIQALANSLPLNTQLVGNPRKATAWFCSVGLCSRSRTMRETLCQARARQSHWARGPVETERCEWRCSPGRASPSSEPALRSQTGQW